MDGMPDKSATYTIKDAQSLWESAVDSNARPELSIKSAEKHAGAVAAARLLLRARRVGERGEETQDPDDIDYEILDMLGQGGMGMVFSARQASLDREIAIKMIHPESSRDAEAINNFVAEAMVTSELDHPNIVPVHDMGGREDGTLFYAMKQVRGTSWDKVIKQKSRAENLKILSDVCDAVAYAHDKGVVHRDLKPENVMLGEYGEVLVLDWGLAISTGSEKAERLTSESGRAGTPAYMSPEMARCDIAQIGPASDIYLLGGILYEIVTGVRPHPDENIYACICSAMENVIAPTEEKVELVDIALKAMSTAPEDRYKTVKDFQQAIKNYQEHAESLKLSDIANERLAALDEVSEKGLYRESNQIIAGFEQALQLWAENEEAILGLRQIREHMVESCLERGDLALAQTQVSEISAECMRYRTDNIFLEEPVSLLQRVELETERIRKKDKMALLMRWIAIGAASSLIVVLVIAYTVTKSGHNRMVKALRSAEQENYYNTIVKVKQKIDEGMFADAEDYLWDAPMHVRNWEWARLMHLCQQDLLSFETTRTTTSIEASPAGKFILTSSDGAREYLSNGNFSIADSNTPKRIWDAQTGEELGLSASSEKDSLIRVIFSSQDTHFIVRDNQQRWTIWNSVERKRIGTLSANSGEITCAAFTPDAKELFTGDSHGNIAKWQVETCRKLEEFKRYTASVRNITVSADGDILASSSEVGEIKVFKRQDQQELRNWNDLRDVRSIKFTVDSKNIIIEKNKRIQLMRNVYTGAEVFNSDIEYINNEANKNSRGISSSNIPDYSSTSLFFRHFSPDGKYVVSAAHSSTAPQSSMGTIVNASSRIYDGSRAYLWNTTSGEKRNFSIASRAPSRLVFSPDGNYFLVSTSSAGDMRFEAIHKDNTPQRLPLTITALSNANSDAFSPDSKRLVGITKEKDLAIWDTETRRVLRLFRAMGKELLAAIFLPDGIRIATLDSKGVVRILSAGRPESGEENLYGREVSKDGEYALLTKDDKVILWDLKKQKEIVEPKEIKYFSCGAFSPKGDLLLIQGSETSEILETQSGQLIRVLPRLVSLSRNNFSHDGKYIVASESESNLSKVYNIRKDGADIVLDGYTEKAICCAFSIDGKCIATGSKDGSIIVWNSRSGRPIKKLASDKGSIRDIGFSPDTKWLASASDDIVIIWDAKKLKEVFTIPCKGGKLTFMPDSKRLLSIRGSTCTVIDVNAGREIVILEEIPYNTAFSNDGMILLRLYGKTVSRINDFGWNITPKKLEALKRDKYAGYLEDVESSLKRIKAVKNTWIKNIVENSEKQAESGNYVLTIREVQRKVEEGEYEKARELLWSIPLEQRGWEWGRLMWAAYPASGAEKSLLKGDKGRILFTEDNRIQHAALSPPGGIIVTLFGQTAKVREVETINEIHELNHDDYVDQVVYSPDGKKIATTSFSNSDRDGYSGEVKIWNTESGLLLQTIGAIAKSISFSPDSQKLATGEIDGNVKIRDVNTSQVSLVLSMRKGFSHSGMIMNSSFIEAVAYSPDGKRILTGGPEDQLIIWDSTTGKQVLSLASAMQFGSVKSAAFSPDGSKVVAGSFKVAKIWDSKTGKELCTLSGHSNLVSSVSFSPDGTRVLTSGSDNMVKLWDAQTGSELITLTGHTADVTAAFFCADRRSLISVSQDRTVRIWDAIDCKTSRSHISSEIKIMERKEQLARNAIKQVTFNKEREEAEQHMKLVEKDLRYIDRAGKTVSDAAKEHDYEDALKRIESWLSYCQTEEGKDAYMLHVDRCKRLIELKQFLIKSINASPYSSGWSRGSESKNVLAANDSHIKLSDQAVRWDKVDAWQTMKFISHYLSSGQPGVVSDSELGEQYLNAAIYCFVQENNVGVKKAEEFGKKAVSLNSDLKEEVKRLITP